MGTRGRRGEGAGRRGLGASARCAPPRAGLERGAAAGLAAPALAALLLVTLVLAVLIPFPALAADAAPAGLTDAEWGRVRALVGEARYRPAWEPASGTFRASNPAHGWRLAFGARGAAVTPSSNEGWRLALSLSGLGYEGGARSAASGPAVAAEGRRVEYRYEGLTEWFANGEDGLEHGFTIASPPGPRTGGPLRIELGIDTALRPNVTSDGDAIAFRDEAGGAVFRYGELHAFDATGRELPSSMSLSPGAGGVVISIDDAGAEYPLTVDPTLVNEAKKVTASDGAAYDEFGVSVAVSGDTMVVGAYCDESMRGSAYVFYRDQGGAGNWGEAKKIAASDGAVNDRFGVSIAISGDTMVVGADGDDSQKGSAYVFSRNQGGAGNWGLVKKITASDGAANDQFGISVAVSGDTLVVGAKGDDSSKGSAYVFSRNQGGAGNWGEVKKVTASDGAASDYFGASVAVDGDTAVVGAYGDDSNKGSAYVFSRNQGGAGNWGEAKKVTASDGAASDYFGASIAVSGDTMVVGAPGDDSWKGSAYVFSRDMGGAGNWGEAKKVTASDGAANDYFGRYVSVSGDTAVAGANGHDSYKGAAYVFYSDSGTANNWGEAKKLTASDGAADDFFGNTVAVSGDTIVVASPASSGYQGSVYVFARDQGGAGTWGEVKRLTASDGATGDFFGSALAVSGDTIVAGAGSANVGANTGQGAAYVFYRDHGGADNWGEVKKLTASDGAANDGFGRSVSVSGDTIVVGAGAKTVGANTGQGAAYVFSRDQGGAGNWGEARKLTASDGAASDYFGRSVSVSGDTIVVGADYDDVGANTDQGSAYVFSRDQGGAGNWGEVKRLTASDGAGADYLGTSVSVSGDTIVVGATYDDVGANTDQGSAYVFSRDQGGAGNWGEVKKLTASDGAANDRFGFSLSVSGNTIVVGAKYCTVDANAYQGSAYVFYRDRGGAGNWGEARKLAASDGAENDQFGASSVSGDVIVVGAFSHDVGANANQGSAYVFYRSLSNQTQSNAAPVLDDGQSPALTAISEDDSSSAGTAVAAIVVDGSITDADGAVEAIAVTAVDNTNGMWQYSLDNGGTWSYFSWIEGEPVDIASSARLLDGTLTGASTHKVRFVPNANWNGEATFTFRAWDRTSGSAGGTADATTNGGSTAFSSATDAASVTVTAANDAPVNTVPGAQTTEEDTAKLFVSTAGNQISIADVDAGAASVQVTLTGTYGVVTLAGTSGLSFTAGDGTADATMSFTGTITSINAALDGLSFAPTPNYNGAASLQVVTNDLGNSGTGGSLSDTDTVSITVTAVNDAPVFTSSPVTAATEDSAYSYRVYTGDVDDDHVTVTAVTKPAWLTLTTQSDIIGNFAGTPGSYGFGGDGGPADQALLYVPNDVDVDGAGTVAITDRDAGRIRVVPAASGTYFGQAMTAGYIYSIASGLWAPVGLAFDDDGNLYVSDTDRYLVKRIAAADGGITTVAGTGVSGTAGVGGPATSAQLSWVSYLDVDAIGNLFICDTNAGRILMVPAANGMYYGQSMVAGNLYLVAGGFNYPWGVAVDGVGNLYLTDANNQTVKKIGPTGAVTVIAGTGTAGFSGDGGPATSAKVDTPFGVEVDRAGNVYITDKGNGRIRRIGTDGIITTIAGGGSAAGPSYGDGGVATSASLLNPHGGIAIDASGAMYIADKNHDRVRKVEDIVTLSGTPRDSDAGDTSVALLASDGALGAWQNFTIDIAGLNEAPVSGLGHALDFDGVNEYLDLPGTWGGPGWSELTVEAWVKVGADTADMQGIFSSTGYDFLHLQLYPSGGNNAIFTDSGNAALPIIPAGPYGEWRHIALVAKSGASKVFVNGQQIGTTATQTFSYLTQASGVRIGSGYLSGRFLNGTMDEVRVWRTALDEATIRSWMYREVDSSHASYANLFAYYKLDEGTGTTAYDSTGTNDGTLTDMEAGDWVVNGFGKALDFDGTDDRITLPATAIDDMAEGTLEAWVYLDTNDMEPVFVKQHNGVNTFGALSVGVSVSTVGLATAGDAGRVYFHPRNSAQNLASTQTLSTGQWYHLAVTFSATEARLYVNGELDATASGDFSIPSDLRDCA